MELIKKNNNKKTMNQNYLHKTLESAFSTLKKNMEFDKNILPKHEIALIVDQDKIEKHLNVLPYACKSKIDGDLKYKITYSLTRKDVDQLFSKFPALRLKTRLVVLQNGSNPFHAKEFSNSEMENCYHPSSKLGLRQESMDKILSNFRRQMGKEDTLELKDTYLACFKSTNQEIQYNDEITIINRREMLMKIIYKRIKEGKGKGKFLIQFYTTCRDGFGDLYGYKGGIKEKRKAIQMEEYTNYIEIPKKQKTIIDVVDDDITIISHQLEK